MRAKDTFLKLIITLAGDLLGRHYEIIDVLPHDFYRLNFSLFWCERYLYMLEWILIYIAYIVKL